MLVDRVRMFVVALLLLLAACGGGGGDPGTLSAPCSTRGHDRFAASGCEWPADRRQSRPAHHRPQQFHARPGRCANARPTSRPAAIPLPPPASPSGGATYTPTPVTQTVAVPAGASVTAIVGYGSTTLTLALADIGPAFTSPTFVTAPPGDDRLFVLERRGVIRIVRNGAMLTQPWLDISASVFTGGEGGLLSMAFDPNFASNGYFYVYYTDPGQNIVVERYTASSTPDLADPRSNLAILRVAHPDLHQSLRRPGRVRAGRHAVCGAGRRRRRGRPGRQCPEPRCPAR